MVNLNEIKKSISRHLRMQNDFIYDDCSMITISDFIESQLSFRFKML